MATKFNSCLPGEHSGFSDTRTRKARFSKRVVTGDDGIDLTRSSRAANMEVMSAEEIAVATTGSIAEPERKASTSAPFVAILPEMDRRLSDFLPARGDIGHQSSATAMVAKSPADTQKRRVKAMPELPVGVGGSIRDTAKAGGGYKQLPTDAYRKMAENGSNWGIGGKLRVTLPK